MVTFYLLLIVLLSIGYMLESSSFLSVGWGLVLVAVVAYFMHKKRQLGVVNNWLNPSYLLLLVIVIVSLQTIINISVGIAPFSTYMPSTYRPYLIQATYVGFISIIAYLCGNSVRIAHFRIISKRRREYVLTPWLILLLIFFVLFLINIELAEFINGSVYIGSGAFNRDVSNSGYYEQLLDVTLVIVTSIVTYRNLGKQEKMTIRSFLSSFPIVFWVVLILYVLLRMLSGDRGPVLYSICLVFYSYLMCLKHKFRLITVMAFIGSAALFTTLLGVARSSDLNLSFMERIESASLNSENNEPSVLYATQELANSVNTEFIILKASHEEGFSFTYGKYTIFALIGSIPGSSYLLSNIFGVNMRDTLSSEFITKYHLGSQYGFGLGTSPMAEFYLEFGLIGIIIGFYFLGWLFNHLDYSVFQANEKKPIWLIIISLKLSSLAIYIPRSTVPGCVSKALYTLIIFLVLNYFLQLFAKTKFRKIEK